jgi:lysophospholipase L1-like esterase
VTQQVVKDGPFLFAHVVTASSSDDDRTATVGTAHGGNVYAIKLQRTSGYERHEHREAGMSWSGALAKLGDVRRSDGGLLDVSPIRRPTLVIIGDSISERGFAQFAGSIRYNNHGWWVHALSILRWPLEVVSVAAVSGRTVANVLDGFDAEVTPFAPTWIWGTLGANDHGTDGALVALQFRELAERARAIGSKLMLSTVLPKSSGNMSSTNINTTAAMNRALRQLRREGLIYLFDGYAALVDPSSATGEASSTTGVLVDSVHPGAYGAFQMGLVAAAVVQPFVAPPFDEVNSNADTRQSYASSQQLLLNPKMAGTTGTEGTGASGDTATSYTLSRATGSNLTLTGSKIDETTPRRRTWQRITFGGTCSGIEIGQLQQNVVFTNLQAAIPVGSMIRARATFRATSLPANLNHIGFIVQGVTSGFVVEMQATSNATDTTPQVAAPSGEFVLETPPFELTATIARVHSSIQFSFGTGAASGTLDITDVEIVFV